MVSDEPDLAPSIKELKIIAAGVVSSFIEKNELEYREQPWWDSSSIIQR